ncbi:MAG: hypothetical protein HRT65_07995 [Flavobacteriaceae bacterium]|nr:hypothetical protein [Flavobacteriaceae bacterium]
MVRLLPVFLGIVFFSVNAQQRLYEIRFEHFNESRGDSEKRLIAELPYLETVVQFNPMNSRSGLGPVLNLHGNIVVIEQMDLQPDGTTAVVIRREDGKDFFGYRRTLKAILRPIDQMDSIPKTNTNENND